MNRYLMYVIAGYLSGSVLYARVFLQLFGKADEYRQSKDENPGTANAFAYGGFACGVLTLAGDMLKGFLPVWLFLHSGEDITPVTLALVLLAPVLGHAFSCFYGLRGGKGIAVAVGCLFVTFGVMGALLEIAVFAVVVAISRFVSAGSLAAAIVCPIFAAYYFLFQVFDPIAWVLCLVTALVVIWAHRGNIHRLATGTERRIGDKAQE